MNFGELQNPVPPDDAPWCPLNGRPVTPGWRYKLAYHARGDARFDIWDATNKAWIENTVQFTIVQKDDWRQETVTFIAPAGCLEVWFAFRFAQGKTSYVDDVSMVWAPEDRSWVDCDFLGEWDDAIAEANRATNPARGCMFALPLSLALWALIGLAVWLILR